MASIKFNKLVAVLVFVSALGGGYPGSLAADERTRLPVTSGNGHEIFVVEVMRSPEERAQGLMHRRELAADAGMLFDFQRTQIVRMWMKNTYIPLDMLFIRKDGIIANIARNTEPHSTRVISSAVPVRYVLEINAGLSARLGITAGDKVDLSPIR